jgi:AcrR family transcriptional regulator
MSRSPDDPTDDPADGRAGEPADADADVGAAVGAEESDDRAAQEPDGGQASAAPAGRSYRGVAAGARVAARRARFVEAGVEVFGTVGVRGATVRGICAAAALTDRYFYESFDGVEALLRAVHATLVARLREALVREVIASPAWGGDRAEVAALATRGYEVWFDFVRDPRVGRIVLEEIVGVSAAMDAQYEAALDDLAELTVSPVDIALPGHPMPALRRRLIGRALAGAALQVARHWMSTGYAAPREDVVRTCVLLATGTMAALKEAATQADSEPRAG